MESVPLECQPERSEGAEARSSHFGLPLSINSIFRIRLQPFSCFSRSNRVTNIGGALHMHQSNDLVSIGVVVWMDAGAMLGYATGQVVRNTDV